MIKKTVTEEKELLLSVRNQDRKKVRLKIEEADKLSNITRLNNLIYAGVKVVGVKFGIS